MYNEKSPETVRFQSKNKFLFCIPLSIMKKVRKDLSNAFHNKLKFKVKNLDYIGIEVIIKQGTIDFSKWSCGQDDKTNDRYEIDLKKGFTSINHHHLEKYFFGKELEVLKDIKKIVEEVHINS